MPTFTVPNTTNPNFAWEASKQPIEINGLAPNKFRFLIQSLPLTTYFVQSADIPSINLGVAMQGTPLVDIPHPGEKLVFDPLTITFTVQEDLGNYNELYLWLSGLGFPIDNQQFIDYTNSQGFKLQGTNIKQSEVPQFSDATLLILDAVNNPVASYTFTDCFPISLSGLQFDMTSGDTKFFSATATFRYLVYTFTPIARPIV